MVLAPFSSGTLTEPDFPFFSRHLGDQLAQNLMDAIKSAVDLQNKAGQLILEAPQVAGMGTALATIISNYVSHWATGQTQTFTAALLKGVMHAIDDFARCFQYEEPEGSGQFRYYASLWKKN